MWTYLFRAVDSAGVTIDFPLSARLDAPATKRFFQKALGWPGHPRPRVINMDGNPKIVEQDHRAIKRRVSTSQGCRAFHSAWRTLRGIETGNMIRKGQARWRVRGEITGQAAFVGRLFGLTTA